MSARERSLAHPAFLDRLASIASRGVLHGFRSYYARFKEIMGRSKQRFEDRDWAGLQNDADERLTLYVRAVDDSAAYVEDVLLLHARDPDLWRRARDAYNLLSEDPATGDLARAYFSTVKRRFIPFDAGDHVEAHRELPHQDAFSQEVHLLERPQGPRAVETLLRRILALYRFAIPYVDLDGDIRQSALLIEDRLSEARGQRVAVLKPLFYRGKRAHIIGRIWSSGQFVPLALALTNTDAGLRIAQVFLGNDETSSLFSFTRSPFHVVTSHHRELMAFLRSLAPAKSPADLYAAVGYNNLSKSALLADLFRLVREQGERFQRSRGVKGTVMLVFELPGSRFVLKVIRDRFLARRVETSREKVMRRYRFVSHVERAGRILDIFHFHHVRFERSWLDESLLEELLASAPSTVAADDRYVILREFYAQRKVVPLDVYFRSEADPSAVRRIVIDLGFLHKELAARNIFTGDVVPNNFGVVSPGRHNMRVVSFDYDGYSRVTDVRFLSAPSSRSPGAPGALPAAGGSAASPFDLAGSDPYDDLEGAEERLVIDEEWDVLPDKFRITFGIPEPFREEFERVHGELFAPPYWIGLQDELRRRPEVIDAFPYHMIAR